jgi:hypothetical protein
MSVEIIFAFGISLAVRHSRFLTFVPAHSPMASLSFYHKKYGKRTGTKKYRAYCRTYRKKNKDKINARQRERYQVLTNAVKTG